MDNHIFKFESDIRVQTNEGGIGLTITGVLSELKMLSWWMMLSKKLKKMEIDIDLDDRFVDDFTLVPTELPQGTVIVEDRLEFSTEKYKEDSNTPADERTMKIIQSIANSIDESIEVTIDVPSYNTDGRVPILDLKVSLNESTKKIEYIFYRKPMANRLVTLKDSALSSNVKFASLTLSLL